MKHESLTEGQYYHIYNRGNDGRVLFPEPVYYEQFLYLYDLYINPVAETFAWVLMGNHFHLVVRIKKNLVYRYNIKDRMMKGQSEACKYKKWQTVEDISDEAPVNKVIPVPSRHFSHLFNAYSRYHQNRYCRTGNLFERPFKRKRINNEYYFKRVILYVHQNPVHHGFCSHPKEYPWTSYNSHISDESIRIQREPVLNLFGNDKSYEEAHNLLIDRQEMDTWLEIDTVDYYTQWAVEDCFGKEKTNEK